MSHEIIGERKIMDTSLVFAVVAGIIIIGFAGEFFFKKTGIPIFIFLILTGIILGPILNLFPREPLLPALAIFAELTLLMVLFYGGIGLKPASVLASGGRAFIQTAIYVISSIVLIGFLGTLVLRWDILPSFIFASMIGGETTAAVVVPLSRSMKLQESTAAFLTVESAMNSIFSIVLFFAFVGVYNTGESNWFVALSSIASQFSVGIVSGALLSLVWIFILDRFQKQKFTYVLTLALVLITYSLTSQLGGNGVLAVLVFGIILGNYYLVNRLFRRQINIDSLQKQLGGFQEEMSFLMETLFFVFLGLTFLIKPSLVATNLSLGILFLVVLLVFRFAATRVSTYRSELYTERRTIVLMCAQGLTPATLAILAVSLQIPLADTFLNIATYVIILTNIVTTVGSIVHMRNQKRSFRNPLENTDESPKKLQE
jgi:cell volume regulation protein A